MRSSSTTEHMGTDTADQSALRQLELRCRELEESDKRFRLLTGTIRQIMMAALANGSVVYLNEYFVQYTGIPVQDGLGSNWAQIIHPDDFAAVMKEREINIAAGREFECKARFRRHDGAYRWHLMNTVPVVESGHLHSWICTALDVHELVETERALRQSETRFKLMSETIPQLVWISHPNGKVEFYNSRWYAYTGLSPEVALGGGWNKILHPDDVASTSAAWQKSVELGVPFEVEQRLQAANGTFRWFLTQALPLTDDSGHIARWYGTCTDIDDQKRLQEETQRTGERLDIALDAGRMGAWDLDLTAKSMSWTPSLSRLYGFDPAITGGPVDALEKYVHPDDLTAGKKIVEAAILEGRPFQFEFRITRADGSMRWLEARGHVVTDEKKKAKRVTGVSVDVTERKELDRELARRADDLARSNKELEQFAFVASHDLKEPLRKIAGYAELIQTRYKSKLDEKGERFLTYLQDGVKRMDTIIGDLLTYSRAGRSGQKREAVPMSEVAKEVLFDLEKTLNDVNAKVTVGDLPSVHANRTQMRQLLQNLISNAVKFHGEAPPQIVVGAERSEIGWRFQVKDNGIGIDPQYFERIFEIFQRLHTRNEYPGTGIGLAICKKIVESHGGRLWVESGPGQGSTFFFTLPGA